MRTDVISETSPWVAPIPWNAPEIFDQTDLNCERCQAEGSVQYRVSSDTSDGWIFVCPACWPQFRQQEGYRYGGTRKANRRRRKR